MKLQLVKNKGSLVPCDDADMKKINRIGEGEVYEFKAHKQRNPRFHRKMFALLNFVFENQTHYRQFEGFRRSLIVKAGYFDSIHVHDGTTIIMPQSISYANMDEEEFRELYSAVFDECLQLISPMDSDELENAVLSFL